ncbi:MAG: PEP-CTERM sorting domain-containing protein [Nostoc sp.]|uniref:PEP-CTERM sorting domain-containing protein n=1 Tax=Nostoc sp. TaxID=1180 RepID=UPI002FFB3233
MKIVSKLALAAASLALGFAIVDAKSVSAAIINYAFTVDSSATKGNGFFSFDDSILSGFTPEATIKSLSFQFDNDSSVYTEQDDVNYPDFPVAFQTTSLTGETSFALDYLFNNKSNSASYVSYEIIGEDFTIFSRTSSDIVPISGTVSYRQVPESTPLVGALFACGLGLMMKRKVASVKKVKV